MKAPEFVTALLNPVTMEENINDQETEIYRCQRESHPKALFSFMSPGWFQGDSMPTHTNSIQMSSAQNAKLPLHMYVNRNREKKKKKGKYFL